MLRALDHEENYTAETLWMRLNGLGVAPKYNLPGNRVSSAITQKGTSAARITGVATRQSMRKL
jgi:hypothetical protein